jgi:hypothetical protein
MRQIARILSIPAVLLASSASAKPVDLMCLAPQSSMYFTLTFDEETGHVLFEGLPTTKESIDEKRIVFTMQERDDSFGYVIDRMTGAMFVMNQRTGTSQNSSCKIAKKAF